MKKMQTFEGGKYEIATTILDQAIAEEYLAACVEEAVKAGIDRHQADTIERQNIIEFSKKFNKEIQYRVSNLFAKKEATH